MLNNLFFELLQVSLGTRDGLSRVPNDKEWKELFETAKKQAVVGVLFCGLEKLPEEFLPSEEVFVQWYGRTRKTETRNLELDRVSAEMARYFSSEGFRGCILKGQGNALLYPKPERRQPGDVDIWLEGRRRDIIRYVTKKYPKMMVQVHHVEFPKVDDVEVEVHFFPIYLKNPFHQHRLLLFFAEHAKDQFRHIVRTSGGEEFATPTASFNAVFQLVHVYLHYLFQGVGLRHIVDYYYVLSALNKEASIQERDEVLQTLRSLGMMRFARAMMWVLHEICGMQNECPLCEPDAKEGFIFLDEMMAMGNFGKYDERYWKGEQAGFQFVIQKLRRRARMGMSYPQEIIWDPYFKVRLFLAKSFKV